MRNFFSVLCLISLFALCCPFASAGTPAESPETPKYSLKVGNMSMVVDAALGARVISLQCEGKEILTGPDINPSNFGSTFWTSPQAPWNWPPVPAHDNKPYQVKTLRNGYLMTSGIDPKQPFQILKQFQINRKEEAFVITYSIKNISDKEQNAAAWEVTRVPGAGITFFAADTSTVRPRGILPLQFSYGLTWFPFSESSRGRKLFANGEGWLAYLNQGILFVRSAPDIQTSEVAPKEEEIEIYVNGGKTYIELENQGKYTALKPGESLTWTMKWKLRPTQLAPVPSEALRDEVLQWLKK